MARAGFSLPRHEGFAVVDGLESEGPAVLAAGPAHVETAID